MYNRSFGSEIILSWLILVFKQFVTVQVLTPPNFETLNNLKINAQWITPNLTRTRLSEHRKNHDKYIHENTPDARLPTVNNYFKNLKR